MPIITLSDSVSGAEAKIRTDLGFNCFSFKARVNGDLVETLDAVAGFEQGEGKASSSGIPILFPFPSRIRGAVYEWKDRKYKLKEGDGIGNAIHGLVLDRPWRVSMADDRSAIGEFQLSVDAPDRMEQWPTDFLIELQYTLHPTALRCDIRMVNAGEEDLPWGLGTHPYFKAPLSPTSKFEDCIAQLPAADSWELVNLVPTGRKVPVDDGNDLRLGGKLGELKLDHLFTSMQVENKMIKSVVMDPQAGWQVTQVTDEIFREWVVYTPPKRPSICLEPYTCMTDAINMRKQGLDTGWRVMKPGEEVRTWFEIHVGPIVA